MVDKVRKRLANWKTHFLSKAGRIVLIESTLNSIPLYLLPKATLNELDQICNNFLWGGKKMHLVGKDHTFLPKEKGGLGLEVTTHSML